MPKTYKYPRIVSTIAPDLQHTKQKAAKGRLCCCDVMREEGKKVMCLYFLPLATKIICIILIKSSKVIRYLAETRRNF